MPGHAFIPLGMEDQPNEAGLAFYDRVFDELLKYKIEPIVTLDHFDVPLALVKKYGSWRSRETVELLRPIRDDGFESIQRQSQDLDDFQ